MCGAANYINVLLDKYLIVKKAKPKHNAVEEKPKSYFHSGHFMQKCRLCGQLAVINLEIHL